MSGEWRRRCQWMRCHAWAIQHLTLTAPGQDRVTMLVCELHFEVGMEHLRAGVPPEQRGSSQIYMQRSIQEL